MSSRFNIITIDIVYKGKSREKSRDTNTIVSIPLRVTTIKLYRGNEVLPKIIILRLPRLIDKLRLGRERSGI